MNAPGIGDDSSHPSPLPLPDPLHDTDLRLAASPLDGGTGAPTVRDVEPAIVTPVSTHNDRQLHEPIS